MLYNCRIKWSDEDNAYLAWSYEYPSLMVDGQDFIEAYDELLSVIQFALEDFK